MAYLRLFILMYAISTLFMCVCSYKFHLDLLHLSELHAHMHVCAHNIWPEVVYC